MKKNPKLHELLAVESGLKAQTVATVADLTGTFEKKRVLFTGKNVTYSPFTEDPTSGNVGRTEEELEVNTTVPRELAWISDFLAKSLNATYQVAVGNTLAKADIVLEDDTVLAKDVPATNLLELEKRVAELLTFAKSIPTLDPAKGFKLDPDKGEAIFRAREDVKFRTKKTTKAIVLYPHTDKHPAQVKEVTEDEKVGTVTTLEWSGLITPVQKGQIIERVEMLARAVKKARTRANEVEVPVTEMQDIGNALVNFALFG